MQNNLKNAQNKSKIKAYYVNNYNSNRISALGDTSAKNAGNYVTVYTIKDPVHYEWADDGTVGAVCYTWTINKIVLTTPMLASDEFNFDATTKTITVNLQNFNATYMESWGRISQSHAGTYYFIVSIKDGYKDSVIFDNGRDFVKFEWTILPYDLSNADIVIS